MSTPITVNASPLPATLASAARSIFALAATFAVGRGWITAEHVEGIVTTALIILTAAYGVWKQFSKSSDLASVASSPFVPDSVARVK